MTIAQLVSTPMAYLVLVIAWGANWIIKTLGHDEPWRNTAWFKLVLTVLPIMLGAAFGMLLFQGDASMVERALAGAGSAAPAVVSYATLRQLSEIPGLPPGVRSALMVILARSAEGRGRSEAAGSKEGEEA